ncbi:MAG: ABC transporter ATP-binding protein [Tissierellaceae bacterium]|nr:ABC transporter ATP-binding protein [Tissierellaceae bacterium]
MQKNQGVSLIEALRRLLKNISIHNKMIYFYFIIYTISASIYPFFSIILPKLLISELTLGNMARIKNLISIILGYFILTGILGFVKTYIHDLTYPKITKLRIDYIRDIFDKIVSMDYKYVEDASFLEENSKAMEAASSNGNGIEGIYHKLFETFAIVITILALVVFIGLLNIWILLGLFLNIFVTIWINKKVHKYQYDMKDKIAHAERKKRYYYRTTHDFGYGKDIRIYSFKDRILNNYDEEINNFVYLHKMIKTKEYLLGFIGLGSLLLSNVLTYGVLIYKGLNGMTIADFSMYIAAITNLSILMKTVADNVSFILNEGQYVQDFYTFIDKNLGELGGPRGPIEGDTLEIEFKNVSFKYPNTEKYVFKNLNFKINKGERLAIVGVNGAGKSTLVKLMTGLFDATEGEILINNISIKEFRNKALYSMFSVVFQEVNVLAFTIGENVACSSDNLDEERIMKAIDKVGLGDKIRSFSKGLDQMMLKVIEEDGVEFSGGENQKLVIARALYKDGNMVIMDEPTAALDALAEAEIYENFSELVTGKTAVYISHRLASTKFCDKIALFDKDGLLEYGNHEELINKKGAYYEMFTIQGKYYNEGGLEDETYQEA